MHGSAKKRGGTSKPIVYVAFHHGSLILRILVRVSLPGCGCAQPLPQRVCACDVTVLSREEACSLWTEYLALADPSVAARWPLQSITALRGVHFRTSVLGLEHAAALSILFVHFFPLKFLDFSVFSSLSSFFTDLQAV